jgi:hypothetical protein
MDGMSLANFLLKYLKLKSVSKINPETLLKVS